MEKNRLSNKPKKSVLGSYLLLGLLSLLLTLVVLYEGYRKDASEKISGNIFYESFGVEIPNQYAIHGIDVSKYQQQINWQNVQKLDAEGIKMGFVFVKATQGLLAKDPFYKRNMQLARAAGLKVGAYHFFEPNVSGNLQAINFINTVKLQAGDLPPVLDIEHINRKNPKKLREQLKIWLQLVEKAYGVKPIIYSNVKFYEDYLGNEFGDYPFWAAHYYQPEAPRINRSWLFWQHTQYATVDGIKGKVDLNVFKGDSVAFKALLLP